MANMVVIRYFWIFMIIISQLVFIRCDIASTRDAVAASAAEVLNHPAINHQSTNDSLVMIASSPQERDGLLSDVVTPLWKNLAGSKSQDIKLSIISDKPWITSVTPDGKAVRFVTYLANISSYEPLDLENIRRQFREEVVRQKLPYVWAVPDNDNNTILLSVTGTTTPTSPLAGNTSENANIFPLQSAAINTTGNAIKSQPDSYATTTATTGAASVSRRRRRRTTAANGGATEAPNPFINFTVPADWAGNDMLNQMKTTWPGLALFSNESLPNGYVEFSFRNPNVTSPSVDQATLVTNALSESTTPATSLQQVTSGPLAVGSSEASTSSSLTTVPSEQATTRWSRRARHTTLPANIAQVTVAPRNTEKNINFSVPADWPGNDVLHQLKSAWPGAASFSNDTNAVPNGTVLFSFGDHNATTGPSAVDDLSVPTTTPAGSFLTTKRKRIRVGGFAASSGFTGPLGSGASAMAGGFRTNDNPLISNYTGDFGSDIVPVGGEMNQIMSTSEAPLVPTTLEAGLPSASTTAAPSTTGRGAQKVTTPRRPSPMDNNSPIAFESNPNPLVSDYTGDYRSDIEPVTVSSHDALGSTVTFGPPDEQGMQIVAFNIGDITIVSVENTKQRDEVLNKQLKPLWQNALGPNVSNVELSIDSETPVPSKNGTKARQISYSAQGTSDTPVPVDQVRDQFHQEVAKANLPNVLAVPDSSGNLQLLPAGKAAGITVPPPSATTPLSVTESLRPPTANISVDETTPESGTSMPEVTTESVEETTTSPANITVNVTTTSPNGTLNESVTTIAPNATVNESSTAISLDTNTTVTPAVTTTPINEENVTLSNTTGSLESSSNESTTVSCASSPFAIEDMLVMSSRTRTAQQEVLNGAVLPQWRKVFGDTAENLTVTYIKDARRSSPPNVRDVQYRINGVGNCRLNVPQAMLDFHNNIANASIPEIAAVPESDGSLKFLPVSNHTDATTSTTMSPVLNQTTARKLHFTTPAWAKNLTPRQNATESTTQAPNSTETSRGSAVMENTTLALNVSSAITTAASNNTNTVNEPVNNATTAAPNATTSALSTPPSLTTTTPRCPNDTSSNTTPANFLGKRPMFAVNLRADPEIFELLQTIKSLKPVQSSFGVHKVAIHGRIGTIADVENALLYAWTPSGKTPEQSGLTIKIISINDYGTFSEKGEPVVDIAYVVGMKPVPITARNKFTSSSIVIRVPTTQIIGSRLAERNISMCSCNVYRGELLHIKEIFDLSANVSSYVDALRNAWESHKPVSACGESVVKAFGGIPVTTIQPEGARMRFTTIPYFVISNDKPWNHPESRPDQSELSKQLQEKGLNSDLYDGTAPISKDLSFVDYLNGSISFQEIPKVNTELADYISNATDQSPLKPILWNLEPFINSNGSIVTQEGFFIVLPNNRTLDPRLFYADAIKDTMKNRSSETLVPNPIIPLYLKGQLQEEQWPTIINSLSSVQPNSNFTVVGMEYGLQAFDNSTRDVTEVLVSTALPNGDSEVLPEIFSTLAKTLYSDLTADALDTALSNLNMSVCRNCQYSKLRMLNLLRTGTDVDPKQNLGTDVILNRISSSWNESNAVTNEGIPLNVQLIGRDDMLANENGTLVSQFSYSVAYPSPARHWYIVREPTPELFNKAFADLHVEPFAGALVHL